MRHYQEVLKIAVVVFFLILAEGYILHNLLISFPRERFHHDSCLISHSFLVLVAHHMREHEEQLLFPEGKRGEHLLTTRGHPSAMHGVKHSCIQDFNSTQPSQSDKRKYFLFQNRGCVCREVGVTRVLLEQKQFVTTISKIYKSVLMDVIFTEQ